MHSSRCGKTRVIHEVSTALLHTHTYVTSHYTLYSSSGLHSQVAGAKGRPLEAAEVAFGVRLALKAMIVYCSTLVKA